MLQSLMWLYIRVYILRIFGALISLMFRISGIPQPTLTLRVRIPPYDRPLRCDVYLPERYRKADGVTFPAYINLHGGGFVAGTSSDDGEFCSFLAREGGCVVVSLAYKLAPEHKYPAAVSDAAGAVRWLKREECPLRIDPKKIALGGFSAGATVAAAAAQLVKDDITTLVNFYGVLDLRQMGVHPHDWMGRIAHQAYIPQGADIQDPLLSPIFAEPGAFPGHCVSIIADIDPHAEDNLALSKKLEGDSQRRTVSRSYADVYHGWTHVPAWVPSIANETKKWEAFQLVTNELKHAWSHKT